MQRNFFIQLVVFITTLLLILMFFFPDYSYVRKMIYNRIEIITLLLVAGLYLKDLLRS